MIAGRLQDIVHIMMRRGVKNGKLGAIIVNS